jgi:retron-type reverse transcriptase
VFFVFTANWESLMSLEHLELRFVTQHGGTYNDFLRRYETAASEACSGKRKAYEEFCRNLLALASDERNLMAAADHLRRGGGTAPGPDGVRLSDYSQIELWMLVRELRNQICSGAYVRGPLKRCLVPKGYGSKQKRTVYLMNVPDRIVSRGLSQILTPLLEPVADPLSFCWRRKGGQVAMAFAQRRLVEEGRTTWIVEDARAAFDRVPRERLLQILRHYVPNEKLCQLVLHLVEPPTKRGILQGSALSMLLLDVYFSHLLHRPWRREENLPPLARYVDDCLVALRPEEDAAAVYERLSRQFRNAAMTPKHGAAKAIVDLRYETAEWLGYRLRLVRGQLEIRPKLFDPLSDDSDRAHAILFEAFAKLHDIPEPWKYANRPVSGIIAHLAPTLPYVDSQAIYRRIAAAAHEAGFEEIWTFPQALEQWQEAHQRWQRVCRYITDRFTSP